ncbi:G-protein coupled receptor GRL101-like [Ylistrum balloti]|uniref:G-protein coupled receptor GRL101-like n=1 Tax=Ylistrum balloti TaxID=509963 RepID=UPI002905B2EA|nr:G-protein coupled receptor GRL101-like [Ylistrum balloti]
MAYNKITNLPDNVFSGLSKLITLDLSRNRISAIPDNIFRDLNKLKFLSLPGNKIRSIASKGFFGLHNIDYINLDENELTNLHADVFAGLPHLYFLDLSSNRLTELHEKVFLGITGRIFLKLDHNKLRTIPTLPHNIKLLDVSENLITSLPVGIFSNCSKLYLLNLIGNEIEITRDIFQGLDDLRYLITGNPTMCCIKPKSVTDEKCLALEQLGTDCLERAVSCPIAKSDAISSCTNLIGSDVLRVFLWIIGLCALLGNVVVIAYRVFIDRDNFKNTYSLFVLNLGISDLLMGIYLLIIGIADAYYQGVYAWYDQFWRRSIFCTIGGVLSFISSEMSTFLILLVTLDRLIVIVLPLSHLSKWRISWIQAILISVFFWTFSIILSILPIVSFQSYFEGKFYSQAGVCLALPLLGDEQPGAEYSFAVFVCLNSFVFGIIVVGQICILKTIRMKTRNIASSVTIKRERTVAKTLFLVVASDFCCWFPVGILGLLARCGIPISNEAYAWVIVFVLPINAAVNPFLYTVTSFLRKRQREQYIASMTSTKLLRRQPETVVVESTAP